MTTVTTADRIPLDAMERIIETAMAGLDLTHDTAWVRPESCPCHRLGLERCTQYDGKCQGSAAEVDTPPEHVITAGHLLSALPVPDSAGTVDARDAALSLIEVIEERLLPHPYTLRAHHLRDRLVAASQEYEEQAGLTGSSDVPEDAGPWMPRCQWCSQPCRDKRARYCCGSHRQQAYKKRRREQG